MAGSARLTTDLSRNAAPVPSAAAATSHRPPADVSRMSGSAATRPSQAAQLPITIRRCGGAGRRRRRRASPVAVTPRSSHVARCVDHSTRSWAVHATVARTSPAPIVNDRAAVPVISTAMAPSSGASSSAFCCGAAATIQSIVGTRRSASDGGGAPSSGPRGREQVGPDVGVVVEGVGVRQQRRVVCAEVAQRQLEVERLQVGEGVERLGAHGRVVVEDLVGAPRAPGLDVALLGRFRGQPRMASGSAVRSTTSQNSVPRWATTSCTDHPAQPARRLPLGFRQRPADVEHGGPVGAEGVDRLRPSSPGLLCDLQFA